MCTVFDSGNKVYIMMELVTRLYKVLALHSQIRDRALVGIYEPVGPARRGSTDESLLDVFHGNR